LLEYETLTGDEIKELMDSGKLERPETPSGGGVPTVPLRGSAVPKAGKRFGDGSVAAQGA
jgi:cell division protease FtsH